MTYEEAKTHVYEAAEDTYNVLHDVYTQSEKDEKLIIKFARTIAESFAQFVCYITDSVKVEEIDDAAVTCADLAHKGENAIPEISRFAEKAIDSKIAELSKSNNKTLSKTALQTGLLRVNIKALAASACYELELAKHEEIAARDPDKIGVPHIAGLGVQLDVVNIIKKHVAIVKDMKANPESYIKAISENIDGRHFEKDKIYDAIITVMKKYGTTLDVAKINKEIDILKIASRVTYEELKKNEDKGQAFRVKDSFDSEISYLKALRNVISDTKSLRAVKEAPKKNKPTERNF